MKRSEVVLFAALCALPLTAHGVAQAPAPATGPKGMVLDDLDKLLRVGAPVLSPDGAWIAYTVSRIDSGDDKSITSLWMVNWDGKQDIQLNLRQGLRG